MTLDAKVKGLAEIHARRASLEREVKELKRSEAEYATAIQMDPSFDPEHFRQAYCEVTLREEFPCSDPMPWSVVESLPLSDDDKTKLERGVCFRDVIDANDAYKIVSNCTPQGAITPSSLVKLIIRTQDFEYSSRSERQRVLAYPDLQVVIPGAIHRQLPMAETLEPVYKFAMRKRREQ
jgi:hypothetical protein